VAGSKKKKVKPFDRLEPWLQDTFLHHDLYKGLPGALVISAMDSAHQAEMSERGRRSAQNKHAKLNLIKLDAQSEFGKVRHNYTHRQKVAEHLFSKFGGAKYGTYYNWVCEWW
jgi:hypothetical protein